MNINNLNNNNSNYNLRFIDVLAKDYNYLKFSALLLIVMLTVFLNVFILLAVYLKRSMRNFVNYQFTSIALSDLIVGAIAMPSLLVSTTYGYWPLGRSLCILWCIADFFACNVSTLNLVMISVHRLSCIRKPFLRKSKYEAKIQVLSILLIWLIPFVSWSISIVVIQVDPALNIYMEPDQCFFMYTFAYVITADTLAYFLPALILVILQIMIYIALKQQSNKIQPKLPPNIMIIHTIQAPADGILYDRFIIGLPTQDSSKKERRKNKSVRIRKSFSFLKNEKAFKSLLLLATSYLVLWIPWISIWPVQSFCGGCVANWYYETTYWLQYSNSLANPIFLLIGHVAFRDVALGMMKSFKMKIFAR